MTKFKAGDKAVLKVDLGVYHRGDVVTLQKVRNIYNRKEFDWSAEVDGEHVFHVHNYEIEPYQSGDDDRLSKLEVTVNELGKLVAGLQWDTADMPKKKTRTEEFADYPVEHIYTTSDNKRFVKVAPDSWVYISTDIRRSDESYIYRDEQMEYV